MKCLSALLIGVVTVSGSAASGAESNAPAPVYTNKTRFRIPFQFDQAEMQRMEAREIRLYVSSDRGLQWRHAQSVTPQAARFDFQAPGDGEYWFAVRTLDSRNQLFPAQPLVQPGLKVIVDTREPVLNVALRQKEPGLVELEWTALDENLNADSLELEYMQQGWETWKTVAIQPSRSGRTSWRVREPGLVAVRGAIQDAASNTGTARSQVEVKPSQPSVPDFSQPIASADGGRGALGRRSPWPGHSVDEQPAPPESIPPRPDDPEVAAAPPAAAPDQPERTSAPFEQGVGSSLPRIEPGKADPPLSIPTPQARQQADSGGRPEGKQNAAERVSRPPATPDRLRESVTRPSYRVGRDTRVVNSRRFQIGYRIDDVGPSGVSGVELYITQDRGEKWYKYGEDPDQASPFEVEVPEDGEYGFTLRARNGLGLGSRPPQPGQAPAITVIVDKTPPEVKLLPVQQGEGESLNEILIQWEARDAYPTEKSIALAYSEDPRGPWEPISGWIDNSGNFLWKTGPQSPSRFFIRLTARDAAGNVARAETAQPVIVDLSQPAARIVGVESVQTSGPR